jgi:hypothetical protein
MQPHETTKKVLAVIFSYNLPQMPNLLPRAYPKSSKGLSGIWITLFNHNVVT